MGSVEDLLSCRRALRRINWERMRLVRLPQQPFFSPAQHSLTQLSHHSG